MVEHAYRCYFEFQIGATNSLYSNILLMIDAWSLNFLSGQKRLDAIALKRAGRMSAAIYLMGYALEFALKHKIAHTLAFASGFPESRSELNFYAPQIQTFNTISTGIPLTNIGQIKNHKLDLLLSYSGAESRIKSSYLNEWMIVREWNPENRYIIKRYSKDKVNEFLKAGEVIVNEIV